MPRNVEPEPEFSDAWRELVPKGLTPAEQIIYVSDLAQRRAIVRGIPPEEKALAIQELFPDFKRMVRQPKNMKNSQKP